MSGEIKISGHDVAQAMIAETASRVMATLTPQARDAVLASAVKTIIGDYSVTAKVTEIVSASIAGHAREYMERPEVAERVRTVVADAVERSTRELAGCVERSILKGFAGTDRYPDSAMQSEVRAVIALKWPETEKKP